MSNDSFDETNMFWWFNLGLRFFLVAMAGLKFLRHRSSMKSGRLERGYTFSFISRHYESIVP